MIHDFINGGIEKTKRRRVIYIIGWLLDDLYEMIKQGGVYEREKD